MRQLSPVSVHEGAHAAAVEALNRSVCLASVQPSGPYAAVVRWHDEPAPGEPESLRRRMYVRGVISLCGAIAESRFSGLPLRQFLKGDDLRDAREAATVIALSLESWSPDARGRVFGRLLREARELVDEQWHAIMEVARALEYGRTLNGAQVARLVNFANKRGSTNVESRWYLQMIRTMAMNT